MMRQILQVCHFNSVCIFCLGCKTIGRRAARRLIVLRLKRNIERELKWQACFGTLPRKLSCSSGKGLRNIALVDVSLLLPSFCTVLFQLIITLKVLDHEEHLFCYNSFVKNENKIMESSIDQLNNQRINKCLAQSMSDVSLNATVGGGAIIRYFL